VFFAVSKWLFSKRKAVGDKGIKVVGIKKALDNVLLFDN